MFSLSSTQFQLLYIATLSNLFTTCTNLWLSDRALQCFLLHLLVQDEQLQNTHLEYESILIYTSCRSLKNTNNEKKQWQWKHPIKVTFILCSDIVDSHIMTATFTSKAVFTTLPQFNGAFVPCHNCVIKWNLTLKGCRLVFTHHYILYALCELNGLSWFGNKTKIYQLFLLQ